MNAVDTVEVDRYLARVRAALSDLPEEARDDLLEDLPAHFAEVLDEHGGSLEERLGPPEAYAVELRAAAGLDEVPPRGRARLGPAVDRVAAWLRVADVRAGSLVKYERISDFGRQLVPAWWLVRGWLLAVLLFDPGPLPDDQLNQPLGWLLVAVLAVASVRIGPISPRLPARARWVAVGAAVVLALGSFAALTGGPPYVDANYTPDRWSQVTNVYPYDKNGQPLHDVVLYDQNGDALLFGDYWKCADPDQERTLPRYPLCLGPRVGQPEPTASPTASPSPGPSPSR